MRIVRFSKKTLEKIAKETANKLNAGKVIACPTDTVYGLIADATNRKAVRKVLLIKGREKTKPLPIFIKDIAMAKKFAKVEPLQEKFLKKVWPGKVTAVLESRGILPKETGTQESIGLRIPNYDFVTSLLSAYNKPLTGTSANLSGEPPLSDSKEISRQFQNRKHAPDILIDAGKLPFSRPSKVIDIRRQKAKILRQ